MTSANSDRLRVLAAFIRSQAWQTDRTPQPVRPGDVQLNQEEAFIVADAIEELLDYLEDADENERVDEQAPPRSDDR